ncbi:ade [Brucella suis bv. 1 str. S2]|uniref:Adenine deaminase n=1 Tax=Brucella suis biovar 1 (strain 1330) TaxID=204722 RepID=ADEC_BRUSU|nr:RecName: Full=Adenine deaminase; Short=Adenase; Short=Adenine aminase [Brucella suis 1330]AEU07789.1 adenine deaminase [Brucella suis VBI22]AHN48386.1 ade [Brucella suis bv. 1 str. S2]AAN33842.1 adenine deaminase [Brucella suis 1330]AEM20118.1 adenine deaminase [Brucella suis 1330]KFJ30581.1 adenine deaminase [Brucella suis 1330]
MRHCDSFCELIPMKGCEAMLEWMIDQGAGREPADIVLKGGRFLDLITGELVESDIAICEDRIVGTFGTYRGKHEIDVSGRIVVPGFIDTHLHIESSQVTPHEFDRCVLPQGVTTAICDPHEIANVLGAEGIRFFLDSALETVMDIRVQLSSCVPATHMETSGVELLIDDLLPFADHPKVIGLAEFMNFPGVLAKDPECMAKLRAFQGRHIDGHAPLLRGLDLNGYIAAGIRTEHEATNAEEALEKLRKGMYVLVREGSVSKDLKALMPIITERHAQFLALCTDDRNPLDIADQGHLDYLIRTAIAGGVEPLAIYRAASVSAARAFGLFDRGLVAPGQRADLVVVDSLEGCHAEIVLSAGRVVSEALFAARKPVAEVGRNSVKAPRVTASNFRSQSNSGKTRAIGIVPGKIITQNLEFDLKVGPNGVEPDLERDVVKVAVIERHGKNGNIATGFVHGFGLKAGAIASTVSHDSHNICVVGASDEDIATAANRLGEIEGGFVVVRDGKVLAEMPLPIAGLMSTEPYETVREALRKLRHAAEDLGSVLEEPFLQLAFIALPVIPHLKITDRGLVDVDKFEFVGN